MKISYADYYDKVLGGWIGKCIGGTIGDRFEGNKNFIEIERNTMFPNQVPPNDDLDLQVLWLKVIEEKGAALTSNDIADAWMEGCWYPFNEYGIFRRNYAIDIKPPMSGKFNNQFWETGMGCPIRSEIWGYSFPGAPDLAAHYAKLDGVTDHTEQSVGAEQMFSAMASMAFFVDDWRELAHRYMHFLPAGSPIERLTREAFRAYDEGLSLRDARERILLLAGNPEACDSQINVPFTFLGLLYGGNDLEETMVAALRCGYDTDCTMATAGAFLGQILGASRIPQNLKDHIGDELVMGIQYTREEMTLSALARDTARVGVLMSRDIGTGMVIEDAPDFEPMPKVKKPTASIEVDYIGLPAAAPGDTASVRVKITGPARINGTIKVTPPNGWSALPAELPIDDAGAVIQLRADANAKTWPLHNRFEVSFTGSDGITASETFGLAGAGLWKLLKIGYDAVPTEAAIEADPEMRNVAFNHHFIDLEKDYLANPTENIDANYTTTSRLLGKPAIVPSYEHEVDVSRVVGLEGPFVAYLSRTVIMPESRSVWLAIGNTDAFTIWVNGKEVLSATESCPWTPFNKRTTVKLERGKNTIVIKLVKRSDNLHFTFGMRHDSDDGKRARDYRWSMNAEDWLTDIVDVVPEKVTMPHQS